MKILQVLNGELFKCPPLWMMRQAGRYLPEYKETRAKAGGFLDLCYNPELACEVTLQPLRRFDFDAAILFSDILVVPHALGLKVGFLENHGPQVEKIVSMEGVKNLSFDHFLTHLQPVFDAVSLIRARMPGSSALLGFCGAPWTVASYMVAGGSSSDLAPLREFAYSQPDAFKLLIDQLIQASILYLQAQVAAGADALQIFDTWAGLCPAALRKTAVIDAHRAIVDGVREKYPDIKIIGFPRGLGEGLRSYQQLTGVDGVGLDWAVDLHFVIKEMASTKAVQGNLDPLLLVAGGKELDAGVDFILESLQQRPYIFNLGHGIVPHTPIAHVEQMVKRVRG